MNKKYYIKTFGCQMNVSDSERIAAFLEAQNFAVCEKIEEADLAIFNTCGIKQTAENRAYSMIHNLRKAKGKETAIIMTGCLANRPDVQKRMKNSVDLFTEIKDFPRDVFRIPYLVSSIKCEKTQNTKYEIQDTKYDKENIDYLSINPKHSNSFQAYVPIMTGCNNFCSYCVVPYARGREVSRDANEIIDEVQKLVAAGCKHIILLGQNVNSYKSSLKSPSPAGRGWREAPGEGKRVKEEETDFPNLLRKLNRIPGKFWLSYVSSHPKDMSMELIETTAKLKKVCEWIHLPVQAGNDEILRRMNRKYTQKDYLQLIKKIRSSFKQYKPQIPFAISSDVIVGFPGESKTQFSDSETIMQKSKFDMVFFGQYSPRPGTVAFKMKDNVSTKEKTRREVVLNEILKKTTFTNNKKYVGLEMEILIDQVKSDKMPNQAASKAYVYYGKTRTQKNVKIMATKKDLLGTFAKVKITKANIWNLEGELR